MSFFLNRNRLISFQPYENIPCELHEIFFSTWWKSVENSTRSGRPKLTSVQSDRLLNRMVLKDRRQNLSDLTSEFNSLASKSLSKRSGDYIFYNIHDEK